MRIDLTLDVPMHASAVFVDSPSCVAVIACKRICSYLNLQLFSQQAIWLGADAVSVCGQQQLRVCNCARLLVINNTITFIPCESL